MPRKPAKGGKRGTLLFCKRCGYTPSVDPLEGVQLIFPGLARSCPDEPASRACLFSYFPS